MQVVILANDEQKAELISQPMPADTILKWINDPAEFKSFPDAAAYICLLFELSQIEQLIELLPKPVLVNDVNGTAFSSGLTRINAWPGFLVRPLLEAAATAEENKETIAAVAQALNKKVEWTPDIPGFITARVLSMIINEAYITLEEGVSTRDEIDTAMKLGTNYPYGPFEWATRIGLKKIYALLDILSRSRERYRPASLLSKEALQS